LGSSSGVGRIPEHPPAEPELPSNAKRPHFRPRAGQVAAGREPGAWAGWPLSLPLRRFCYAAAGPTVSTALGCSMFSDPSASCPCVSTPIAPASIPDRPRSLPRERLAPAGICEIGSLFTTPAVLLRNFFFGDSGQAPSGAIRAAVSTDVESAGKYLKSCCFTST
jgi:hypothetical protein